MSRSGIEAKGRTLRIDLDRYPELDTRGGALVLEEHGVVLVRGRRKLRAFSDRCPHKPRSKNRVRLGRDAARSCLRCKAHNWTWDKKGRPTGKANERLERYDVRCRDGQAIVKLGNRP